MVSTVGYTTGDTAVLAVLKKVGVIFSFWKNFALYAKKKLSKLNINFQTSLPNPQVLMDV